MDAGRYIGSKRVKETESQLTVETKHDRDIANNINGRNLIIKE